VGGERGPASKGKAKLFLAAHLPRYQKNTAEAFAAAVFEVFSA
jgi:hypothetical protein